jgi:hypothetical protein
MYISTRKGRSPRTGYIRVLDAQGTGLYQSLIGALQWAAAIGRFDIQTAVMTLSGFCIAPRRGHLDMVKRLYGNLSKMYHAAIRVCTDEPDYSDIPDVEHDCSMTVFGEPKEIKPDDALEPVGRFVTSPHYVDANLMHLLHLVNKTQTVSY